MKDKPIKIKLSDLEFEVSGYVHKDDIEQEVLKRLIVIIDGMIHHYERKIQELETNNLYERKYFQPILSMLAGHKASILKKTKSN